MAVRNGQNSAAAHGGRGSTRRRADVRPGVPAPAVARTPLDPDLASILLHRQHTRVRAVGAAFSSTAAFGTAASRTAAARTSTTSTTATSTASASTAVTSSVQATGMPLLCEGCVTGRLQEWWALPIHTWQGRPSSDRPAPHQPTSTLQMGVEMGGRNRDWIVQTAQNEDQRPNIRP